MRRRYYDPIVQTEPVEIAVEQPLVSISGTVVEKPGVYLHAADVVAAIRQMATDIGTWPDAQDAIMQVAQKIEEAAAAPA